MPRTGKSLGLSRKTFAILGACVLIAAAGVVWAVRPQAPPPSLIGGPFQLQDANGKTVTEADFRGEPFLVYFGYTHCPDVCPATLAQISDVMKRLPDKPIKALLLVSGLLVTACSPERRFHSSTSPLKVTESTLLLLTSVRNWE